MDSLINSLVKSILSDITSKDIKQLTDNSFFNHVKKIFDSLPKNDDGLASRHDVILSCIAYLNYFDHFTYPYDEIDRLLKERKTFNYREYENFLIVVCSTRNDNLEEYGD